MRVLYFSDNTSGHNQRFLEKLSQSGLEVWFLNPTTDCLAENWLPDGVSWIRSTRILEANSSPAHFAEFLPQFQRVLKEVNPDFVHAGPIQTCGYLTALSQFHPWLLSSWGSDLLLHARQNPEWEQATQLALTNADSFFCDCDTVRAEAKRWAGLPDSRIVQFPWGLRKGVFGPSGALPPESLYKREPGTHVFLSTRSWEPIYGIDTLLRAFADAYQRDDSLRLLLLGNGSEAEKAQEFVRSHGLSEIIRMPGSYNGDEMPKWFRAVDSYVSCARSDGTSVSLLEAMATGLPVIVTDIPSNREWAVEERNGWLAPADSPTEFADCFLRAAHLGSASRKLISDRNQRVIEERADWDRNFPRLLEMYERMTGLSIGGSEIESGEKRDADPTTDL